jgi:hypothetical protein
MMLTLPERFFLPFELLLPGVVGCDLSTIMDDDGVNIGEGDGETGRGGVEVLVGNVGVGGTKANCGAFFTRLSGWGMLSVCTPILCFFLLLEERCLPICSSTVGDMTPSVPTPLKRLSVPSSRIFFSAFLFNIHHTALAASQASLSTEYTI